MNLSELQAEVGEWSRRNFPNNEPIDPLLGLIEEVGELSHAVLKSRQGIRGTADEHRAAMVDAVGDITIYLLDFCGRCDLVLKRRPSVRPMASGTEAVLDLAREVGSLAGEFDDDTDEVDDTSCMWIFDALATFCAASGIDFNDAVTTTWAAVRQRDWTKHRADGVTP